MFNTADQITAVLAAQLKVDTTQTPLDAFWSTLVAQAQTRAYNEIQMRLLERGYTAAQISAWDRGAEFELDIAVWWCLTQGAGLSAADLKGVDRFDRREELRSVSVSNAGVLINPGALGRIGFGLQSDDQNVFRFRRRNAGDQRVGGPDDSRGSRW